MLSCRQLGGPVIEAPRMPCPAALLKAVSRPLPSQLLLEQLLPPTRQAALPPTGPLQVAYSSSRNRQWHIYTVMERKNRASLALKRVFLR